MCYEEFIREKKLGKIKVKYNASEYKAINLVDEENEGEIDLSPREFKMVANFIQVTEKELEELNKEDEED